MNDRTETDALERMWTKAVVAACSYYHILVLPTFLYGSENWTLTALQRRRIETAEVKLLRPLAVYTLCDHKTNDSVRRELQTECIVDNGENTDGTGFYTCKECH